MNNLLYFEKESPDWNMFIEKGDPNKIAANRCVLSIMTEFGLCNDYSMSARQYTAFIMTTQSTTYNDKTI